MTQQKRNDKKASKNEKTRTLLNFKSDNHWYFLIPILFIVAIVPLIVYLKVIPLHGEAALAWSGQTENSDFFSYYKGVWLEVAAVSALLLMFVKAYLDASRTHLISRSHSRSKSNSDSNVNINSNNYSQFYRRYWTYFYIPVVAYVVTVTLSALYSRYPEIAFQGFPDRYEGLWILLAYMVVLVTTFNLVQNERHITVMIRGILTSAAVIGAIGFFQYLGYDLWKATWVRDLILPSQFLKYADQLKFQFGAHTIYATLYHTDYVGSYAALVFPFTLALFALEKQRRRKIIYGLFTALTAFTWVGCNSRAGMFGGALALLVLLLALRREILGYWKYFAIGVAILILLIVGLDRLSHGYLGQRINSLLADTTGLISRQVTQAEPLPLKDIQVNGNKATVATSDGTLNMALNGDQISFTDAQQNSLHIQSDAAKDEIKLLEPQYSKFQLKMGLLNKKHVIIMQDDQIKLYFGVDNETFTFLDYKGDEIPLQRPPAWGFVGQERLGSSRGYIWSRSLPLLRNTVWLGYGPDTFAAYFPQYDIYGKMYAYYGDMWQLVDKPHDFYLQTGINTGLLSLLALLILFSMYWLDCIRTYFRGDFPSVASRTGVGLWAGVTGYLGAAFFNDSVISVAPVFWVMLGLGIAANRMVRKQRNATTS
ncbi:MAG: O-antigen ligase family protein [Desulfosporosinus sp.]|nr:O-antigen ligase family protein [Desulfosporosinus sp.]